MWALTLLSDTLTVPAIMTNPCTYLEDAPPPTLHSMTCGGLTSRTDSGSDHLP